MNAVFTIKQRVQETGHWEPIPEGEFDSYEAAETAAWELIENLGWCNLAVFDENGTKHAI